MGLGLGRRARFHEVCHATAAGIAQGKTNRRGGQRNAWSKPASARLDGLAMVKCRYRMLATYRLLRALGRFNGR